MIDPIAVLGYSLQTGGVLIAKPQAGDNWE